MLRKLRLRQKDGFPAKKRVLEKVVLHSNFLAVFGESMKYTLYLKNIYLKNTI